ncbi:MAG: hypothetical protein GXP42_07165 [Chloroflexi bacterium]|nr:hypothetical protein [Chloroflexota bacterium]
MVALDTDVLVLAFAFHRDPRQEVNTRFLTFVQKQKPVVTIYSVMELLGRLSFNLSAERLAQWPSWLQDRYSLSLLYPRTTNLDATTFFLNEMVDRPFEMMKKRRMPFLDALILDLVERADDIQMFVTWNARHFSGKTSLDVLTPAQYLRRQ